MNLQVETLPSYLSLEELDRQVNRALQEDLGDGDFTSEWTVPEDVVGTAALVSKESGVLAGTVVADRVFNAVDSSLQISWIALDGEQVDRGQKLASISGHLRSILKGERVMLNFVQRMSGIASHTNAFVRALSDTDTRVLDTRKTAPGLRLLDKWSVLLGGGVNHRLDLSDEVMIKENHISAAGGLRYAIDAVAKQNKEPDEKRVVVEIADIDQIEAALETGHVDRLLLDNMVTIHTDGTIDTSRLAAAVSRVAGRVATEASGNVSLDTVRKIAETGVNFVSVGALTHSVRALDISLLVEATDHPPSASTP